MTRLAPIRHFKKIIAITFAISILAVIACDFVCSVDRTLLLNRKSHLQLASSQAEDTENNHQRHDHAQHDHHDSGATHDHSHDSASDDQDNCCDDITNQFYQSLFKANDTTIAKTPGPTLIFLSVLSDYKYLIATEEYLNAEYIPPKIPPKTTGNYLRILISSFLI